jgi:uncharacterized protein YegL
MANQNLTEIYIIGDRSGSMGNLRDDAIGGINTFRDEQRANQEGECRVTLALFNNEYQVVHDCIPIEDMPELSSRDFVPDGGTALFDAIGKTINDAVARHEAMDEDDRPGTVLVAIVTDGHENSSSEFSRYSGGAAKIQAIIQQRESAGWIFAYLSADMNAMQHGQSIGLSEASVVQTGQDSVGTRASYMAVSQSMSNVRRLRAKGGASRFSQIGAEQLDMQTTYDSLVDDIKSKDESKKDSSDK